MFDFGVLRSTIRLTRNVYRNQYAGSSLGLGWVLIHPFFFLAIFIVVFSKIMDARLAGDISSPYAYSIYLLAGFFPWLAFANTIRRQSTVLLEERGVLAGIPIKLTPFLLSIVFSEIINYGITFMLIAAFLSLIGHPLSWVFLAVMALVVIQQVFASAIGIFAAVCTIFMRDTKEVINIFLQIWFWITPIVYVKDILPENLSRLININPMTHYIGMYQDIILFGRLSFSRFELILVILPFVLLFLSLRVLSKNEKLIRDRL